MLAGIEATTVLFTLGRLKKDCQRTEHYSHPALIAMFLFICVLLTNTCFTSTILFESSQTNQANQLQSK